MSLAVALFAVVALATAVSALGVVLSTNIVRAAVWLLFTLIGVAVTYLLLGAEFVGAAQLIVYVGGTLVLVVFGVMLTAQGPLKALAAKPAEWAVGGTLAAALFGLLAVLALGPHAPPATQSGTEPLPGVGPLGLAFLGFTDVQPEARITGVPEKTGTLRTPVAYLLPFEVVSVHLLVVLIGAAYLARAKRRAKA
ncbi:NADH-quinone oxidoreductase subunit J family protein [Urbifossiella limnaea]|uniref:NADH-quinone oxidoreductase subunit J n=1 Tax=Urbifossiella limnaea TaxID=2528023 RepID=A0A517XZK6_9BACT|nr:NADH-quinone oxidoreductase subunit J [Urbifossiella limnaea]QDU22941.1 NADH-quinone oxidoreductase subunit J [Urbifossiella limnaea]